MIGKHANRALCLAIGVAALGLAACGGSGDGTATTRVPDYKAALAGAPKQLARFYAEGDRLLPGGTAAFQRQLAELRGYPVVVNKWASWCGPCREEFPYFQRLSARFGKRVAFLGVDANDSNAAARTFLGEFPVPYPSYTDPNEDISRLLGAAVGVPSTAFYDANGERLFVKQGQYASQAELAADIRRYATPDPGRDCRVCRHMGNKPDNHRGGGR
jgi:cytochrome c biogenesis protein CcmG, thiol:disulfide interchange protein DsbE